jgi:ribonuclease I
MGPNTRPMQQEWVLNIKRQCDEQRSAFFFKQWGGWGVDGKKRVKKQNGRLLQGRTWDAVPEAMTNAKIQSLTRQIPFIGIGPEKNRWFSNSFWCAKRSCKRGLERFNNRLLICM